MTEPKWIRFDLLPRPANRKTDTWAVMNKQYGSFLGRVAWDTGWRRYVFEPQPGTIYEQDCLRDIAAFIEARTAEHKRKGGAK